MFIKYYLRRGLVWMSKRQIKNGYNTYYIAAAIATILGFLIVFIPHNNSNTSPSNPNLGNSTSGTTPIPTNTLPPTIAPTATHRPINPGTVVCSAGETTNWHGWNIGTTWANLNGVMVTSGNATYGFAPTLTPPASCQPQQLGLNNYKIIGNYSGRVAGSG